MIEPLEPRALLSKGVTITGLGMLSGDTESDAYGINDKGEVVGESVDVVQTPFFDTFEHAFSWTQSGGMVGLGVLGEEGDLDDSYAEDVNDSGTIVGASTTDDGDWNGFVSSGGGLSDIPPMGNDNASYAHAINDNGLIVGQSDDDIDEPGTQTATESNGGGGWTALGGTLTGFEFTYANSVNSSGQIVGFESNFDSITGQAFLYTPKTGAQPIPLAGGFSNSTANGINDQGDVVGSEFTGSVSQPFLYTPAGGTQLLPDLPGLTVLAEANDINDAGQIVGDAEDFNGDQAAFVYQTGTMTNLNSLLPANSGWDLQTATGINNQGQVVGTGSFNGTTEAYILKLPPSTIVTTAADNGNNTNPTAGSLRAALMAAQQTPGSTITFAIPGTGTQTITLTAPLPAINFPVTINGTTQEDPGGAPLVDVDGSGLGDDVNGFDFEPGSLGEHDRRARDFRIRQDDRCGRVCQRCTQRDGRRSFGRRWQRDREQHRRRRAHRRWHDERHRRGQLDRAGRQRCGRQRRRRRYHWLRWEHDRRQHNGRAEYHLRQHLRRGRDPKCKRLGQRCGGRLYRAGCIRE
jgi:probable HAF family extracellular repeat protein